LGERSIFAKEGNNPPLSGVGTSSFKRWKKCKKKELRSATSPKGDVSPKNKEKLSQRKKWGGGAPKIPSCTPG